MLAYIKGILEEADSDHIVVENNGMAYSIQVPEHSFHSIASIGDEVKVYTYLHVREDAMKLFGFATRDDLNMFKLLITVNGVGPKAALGILSGVTTDNLRFAILSEDTKTIAKAPGIGPKTAKKLVLELKDKIDLEASITGMFAGEQKSSDTGAGVMVQAGSNDEMLIRNEAVEALTTLGYSGTEALKAVRQVTITSDSTVEEVLKQSLKLIGMQ
ncbi:MAG: Holliday junction branch migration protein RuvA [Lachnospiraceae bacterium]|nr:Holliday junction branch migration protein RuvA [Lachnospiraceae bacterium]